jgi:rod shape-determining protein MreC
MWSLLRYLYRHHVVILFIVLEVIALVFLFSRNNFQRSAFLNSANSITGNVYARYSAVVSYFRLTSVNRELAGENARLRQILFNATGDSVSTGTILIPDSLFTGSYDFIPARVINNSVHRQYNYLTLNKGSKDGVRPDMGVATVDGVVGVVLNVSESYSTVISLLNQRWNIPARLKRNSYFGPLSWDGKDYQIGLLNDIPFHVALHQGDTIVTSGFSTLFPEGLMIGVIESYSKEGGDNFYYIRVKLSVDFKALTYVEIINNRNRREIETLEKISADGADLD